jgi:putative inorganic carbon (hco3(-)) transporter
MAFILYIIYILSFFLHLPERIPVLGSIRFDLVILALATVSIFNSRDQKEKSITNETDRMLYILFAYLAVSLPFVEWPGSVLNTGIQNIMKVLPFYFFTTMTVNSEKRLRIFLIVLIGCQTFRVLEPLYLHLTTGYWGDMAFMGEGEFIDRLAGSPYDPINPNGLAYVIVFLLPFYISFASYSIFHKALSLIMLPVFGYTLILTGSRSGFFVALIIAVAVILRSRKKILVAACVAVMGIALLGNLNLMQQDRYLSIYRNDVRGAGTARGRLEGLMNDINVALTKPLVGHGLGTSHEANFNVSGSTVRSHNLYIEVMQEIGLIGLVIFILYIKESIQAYFTATKIAKALGDRFMISLTGALGIWLLANLVFSMASYGLSGYSWYLFGGLTVVLNRFNKAESAKELSLEGV